MGLCLVLGPARSGKSAYAQGAADAYAQAYGLPRLFIATAEALDDEMAQRIARHRAERSAGWGLDETPLALADAVSRADPQTVVLVDCLTLWLSNSILAPDDDHGRRLAALTAALERRRGATFVVSNEVGWGVVPDNALARQFRDEAGRLHQTIAAFADEVVLVVAGLPLRLKTAPPT